jgi:hypothetical protein
MHEEISLDTRLLNSADELVTSVGIAEQNLYHVVVYGRLTVAHTLLFVSQPLDVRF